MTPDLAATLTLTNTQYVGDLPTLAPGMTGEDVHLYLAWRAHPAIIARRAFFNVRVGPPLDQLTTTTDLTARIRASVAGLRIDMLLHDGVTWWILEFHGHSGLPQLGRLLCYPELLRKTYPTDLPLRSALITSTLNPFLEDSYTSRKIPIFVYDPTTPKPTLVNPDALT